MIIYGTGFFGYIQQSEKSSVVLVTNHHVIGNEEVAGKSSPHFDSVDFQLELEELLVKATFITSDVNMVSFTSFIENNLATLCLYCSWGIIGMHGNQKYTGILKQLLVRKFCNSHNSIK